MKVRKSFRFRLRLTKKQARALQAQLEECRWLYNELLGQRKLAYEELNIALNMMLSQWRLNPPILEYPYVSMTSCLNEWEDQLIDGMIAWQKRYLEVRHFS